jgi:hypothetical protein
MQQQPPLTQAEDPPQRVSHTLWVPDSLVGQVGNPKRPSVNTTSTSSNPAGGAKLAQCMAPSAPLQPAESPQVCCTLWVPDSIASHLISQVGRSLELAATILKARITVLGPSTELGAAHKATIHGTSEEVGVALVVMGKRIAQQHVPNPRKPQKPVKRPTPSLHPPPAIGRDHPTATDFAAGREAAVLATRMTWPPNGIPLFAPRPSPTPSAWDGEPAAHRRGAVPQQPAAIMPMPMSTRHWAFQIAEDDRRGRKRDPPTVEVYARTITWRDTELAQTHQAATARYHARAIEQMDDEDDGPQTTRWSGGGPGRGRGHAPRAQGWTPPKHNPPPADAYAWTIVRVDDDEDQPHQTARWSGSGPNRGRCQGNSL